MKQSWPISAYLKVLLQHSSEGNEENNEKNSQYRRCLGRDLKWLRVKYKTR